MQYCQDYDERLPFNQTNYSGYYGVTGFNDPGSSINQWTSIYPYTKSIQILLCPSAVPYTASPGGLNPDANSNSNYVANTVLLEGSDYTSGPNYLPSGRSLATIPNPAHIVEIQETPQSYSLAQCGPCSAYDPGDPSPADGILARFFYWHDDSGAGTPQIYSNIHFGGGNLLFADGHVKWRLATSLHAYEFGLSTYHTNTASQDDDSVNAGTSYSELF